MATSLASISRISGVFTPLSSLGAPKRYTAPKSSRVAVSRGSFERNVIGLVGFVGHPFDENLVNPIDDGAR